MAVGKLSSKSADVIVQALRHLIRVQKHSYREIFADYQKWCAENKRTCDVVAESVRKWSLEQTVPTKPGSFYEFIVSRAATPDARSSVGMLSRAVSQLFPSGDDDPASKLSKLCGYFEMIRRLWLPANAESCLRTVVRIDKEGGLFVFRAHQKFLTQYKVNETYEGYAFLHGSNIWVLAREEQRQGLQFLNIHECSPDISSKSTLVELCRGTLMAVTSRGPNYSHPFLLRRINEEPFSCRIISTEAVRALLTCNKEFDKISFDFLYDAYGQNETSSR